MGWEQLSVGRRARPEKSNSATHKSARTRLRWRNQAPSRTRPRWARLRGCLCERARIAKTPARSRLGLGSSIRKRRPERVAYVDPAAEGRVDPNNLAAAGIRAVELLRQRVALREEQQARAVGRPEVAVHVAACEQRAADLRPHAAPDMDRVELEYAIGFRVRAKSDARAVRRPGAGGRAAVGDKRAADFSNSAAARSRDVLLRDV